MTNLYSLSEALLRNTSVCSATNTAWRALLVNCRNGFLWSLGVMLPISLLVVPVIPRRLVRDNSGNLIPYFDSVGYWGMISEVFGFVAPVSAIWTLSAGLVGLMSYLRSRGEINIDSQPDEDL